MFRNLLILTLSIFFTALFPAAAYCQQDVMMEVRKHAPPDIPDNEQKAIIDRLLRLSETGTLEQMRAEIDRTEKLWGGLGGENYAEEYRTVLSVLTMYRFEKGAPDLKEVRNKYASTALSHSETYTLDNELRILPFLDTFSRNKVLNEKEAASRRDSMRLWLHALRRLEIEIDPNFKEPESRVKMYVTPPLGADGVAYAGMPPEDIKDPVKRAAYEKAIDDNRKRYEYWNLQIHLLFDNSVVPGSVVLYAATAYAKPPAAPAELADLMTAAGISAEHRKLIEAAVKFPPADGTAH